MSLPDEIPLFPLDVVLFPGGPLPLRIFEPRYVSMVGRCMREDLPFGVVPISAGPEAGGEASFHLLGSSARIRDFDRLPDGMLGITCRGERRFRVLEHNSQPDRLVIGRVEWLPEPVREPVPVQFRSLERLLGRILDAEGIERYRALLEPDWDSADWVVNRLAEVMPLPNGARHMLLGIDEPLERFELLYALLQDQRLV